MTENQPPLFLIVGLNFSNSNNIAISIFFNRHSLLNDPNVISLCRVKVPYTMNGNTNFKEQICSQNSLSCDL